MKKCLSPSPLIALAMLACAAALHAQERKLYSNDPIKVVTIDRKEPVDFVKDVYPILKEKCMFCHTGNVVEGEFDMSTFEGLMKGGKRGTGIIPGKADESLFYLVVGKQKGPRMPPRREKPLEPEELALIKLWIDQGAKAPTGPLPNAKVIVGLPPATVQPVRAVALSPDGKTLVASRGNEIHVYDPDPAKKDVGHLRELIDPAVTTPDGKKVEAAHLTLVESLAYSPDGKHVASGSFQEIKVWEPETGKLVTVIEGLADRVVTLDYSSDGKMLAAGGGPPTEDGEIKILNPENGSVIVDIQGGHSDQVFGVAFSPDDKTLATCGADKFVKTWEVPSGKFLKSFEGHTHHVMDVDWKGDGKLLASGGADNVVKVWDFEKGEQARSINAHGKQVTRLVHIGKTSNFMTCGGDKNVYMWNIDNGRRQRNFNAGADFMYALAASEDGKVVAAGGEDGIVLVYDGQRGQIVKRLVPPGVEPEKK